MSTVSVAARGRGAAVGSLTAALATVAHTWASGSAPSGAGVALLGVLALTLGTIAAAQSTATVPALLALLGFGQLIGHALLAASGHQHAAAPSSATMVGAHIAAVLVCAVLISTAGRLGEALSRAVRAMATRDRPARPVDVDAVAYSADQPLQAALALAFSLSHRGPPAVAR